MGWEGWVGVWPEVALVLTATVKLADVDGWKNGVRQLLPREEA